jgi:hypothetical protein
MNRVEKNTLSRIEINPREAANEHVVLLEELYRDLAEHPPMNEEENRLRKAIEMMDARQREKRYEK